MIAFLCAAIHRDTLGDCTISQRGGGSYHNVQLLAADTVGIVANVAGLSKFIPWTSINEIAES